MTTIDKKLTNVRATKIVEALFQLGSEPNDPCQRLQFMGGTWPDSETSNGGMCKSALIRFVAEQLALTGGEGMSRVIKFRAWDKTNACWYKPDYRGYEGIIKELNIGTSGDLGLRYMDASMGFPEVSSIHSSRFRDTEFKDGFDLMQFTGLHDKNGVEIFEGDIVALGSMNGIRQHGEIVWRKCGFVISVPMIGDKPIYASILGDPIYNNVAEVVGNIHQNPELLEGKASG